MDILTRWRRMQGRAALWQPGTDHAGIATQMVVERKLEREGRDAPRTGAGRLHRARCGTGSTNPAATSPGSCAAWARRSTGPANGSPWTRACPRRSARCSCSCTNRTWSTAASAWSTGTRCCAPPCPTSRWSPPRNRGTSGTCATPSSIPTRHLVVATTRPETMLGDTAVAVHPDDPRYRKFIGQSVRLPLAGRDIPIIADDYVDPEFGSGCVKITPAHDFNDYEVGPAPRPAADQHLHRSTAHLNEDAPEAYRGLSLRRRANRSSQDLEGTGPAGAGGRACPHHPPRRSQRRRGRALPDRPVVRPHPAAGR